MTVTGTQLWRRPSRSRERDVPRGREAGQTPSDVLPVEGLGRPWGGDVPGLCCELLQARRPHTPGAWAPAPGLAWPAAARPSETRALQTRTATGRGGVASATCPEGGSPRFPSVCVTRADQVVPLARPQRLGTSVPGLWERTSTRHRKCEQRPPRAPPTTLPPPAWAAGAGRLLWSGGSRAPFPRHPLEASSGIFPQSPSRGTALAQSRCGSVCAHLCLKHQKVRIFAQDLVSAPVGAPAPPLRPRSLDRPPQSGPEARAVSCPLAPGN